MYPQDAKNRAQDAGDEREQGTAVPTPLSETDSTQRTPLLKNLINRDLLGFMSRFFVNRFPS